MRSAKIYYKDLVAGKLTETNEGEFVFQYDEQCISVITRMSL
jgi:serine/threonine-protein kinase HipA